MTGLALSTAYDPALPAARAPLFTRPFLLASAAHFLHSLAFNVYLHLSGFLETMGASEQFVGAVFGMAGAAAIVVRPPMGRVMDRRGRVVVIRAGGLLHALVCLLYTTVASAGLWIGAVRVAHGVAEAMLFTSLFAFASDIVPTSRRFEGLALFGVSGMLPVSLGPSLGDLLLAAAGGPSLEAYRHLFVVSVVLAGAAFVLSLPLREPVRAGGGEPARGMLAAFRQRDLSPLWLAGAVFATCIAAPFTFFASFVMHEHVGSAGLFFSSYSIAAIVLRIVAGRLPERLGPKRVLFPAMASIALGLAVLVVARSAPLVAMAGILGGLGHGYAFPILLGLVVSRARPNERGAALAIFTSLFDVGNLIGGPLFGLVLQLGDSYRVMFATAAALLAGGIAIFAVMDRGRG